MANYVYPAIGLITGAAGFLDAIDGTNLADKDMAIVSVQGDKTYFYVLDVDSAAPEASPGIIAPDANGGDKRWILTGFTPVPAATGWTGTGGTTSKTLTVTADTSLDEAVAMSSKAPKASPEFTTSLKVTNGVIFSFQVLKLLLADDETASLETVFANGTNGTIFVGNEDGNAAVCGSVCIRGGVNTVTEISDPLTKIAQADTDGSLCFIADGDGTYTIKNRLGYSGYFSLMWLGSGA